MRRQEGASCLGYTHGAQGAASGQVLGHREKETGGLYAGGDFDDAVQYVVEAMLQSPRFVYRVEGQRGDGTPWPVDDY